MPTPAAPPSPAIHRADPTIALVGLAVLGLSSVFRIGGRLQRETNGLV